MNPKGFTTTIRFTDELSTSSSPTHLQVSLSTKDSAFYWDPHAGGSGEHRGIPSAGEWLESMARYRKRYSPRANRDIEEESQKFQNGNSSKNVTCSISNSIVFLSHLYVNLFHDCLIVVLSDPATNHLSYPRSEDAYAPRLPTQLFAAGVKLAAHTQPALRTGLVAPAWRLIHASRRVIFDLA